MTELKTVKDIKFSKSPEKKMHKVDKSINEMVRNLIKKEAIKWVKSKNTGEFSFDIGFDGKVKRWYKKKEKLNFIDTVNLGAMIELINFHNITEDDLK